MPYTMWACSVGRWATSRATTSGPGALRAGAVPPGVPAKRRSRSSATASCRQSPATETTMLAGR